MRNVGEAVGAVGEDGVGAVGGGQRLGGRAAQLPIRADGVNPGTGAAIKGYRQVAASTVGGDIGRPVLYRHRAGLGQSAGGRVYAVAGQIERLAVADVERALVGADGQQGRAAGHGDVGLMGERSSVGVHGVAANLVVILGGNVDIMRHLPASLTRVPQETGGYGR